MSSTGKISIGRGNRDRRRTKWSGCSGGGRLGRKEGGRKKRGRKKEKLQSATTSGVRGGGGGMDHVPGLRK